VVLAATFTVLTVTPVGVLLDTFVVRTVLVPAFVLDAGPGVWWPGRSAQ
jgi:putative drug exporter of the RND superfamily